MTIVHVYAGYVASHAEGITRNVHGLTQGLQRRGEDVRLEASRVDLSELNRLRTHLRNARASRTLLHRAAAREDVELVHHHVNIPAMGATGHRLRGRVRTILHLWNAVYRRRDAAPGVRLRGRWKHRLFNGRLAARWGTSQATEVAVSSQFQARQLRALGYAGIVHVVPNGVDTAMFRPARVERRDAARASFGLGPEPVILYYGHLSPWKGTNDLVRAFGRLRRRGVRAQMLVAHTPYGRGEERLRRLVQRLGLQDSVRLRGLSHVPDLLAAADVIALPYVAAVGTACHPNTLLESLASGHAVVATNVGSIPEVIQDRRNGLLVPPADAGRLSDALEALVTGDSLRRRLGGAARSDAVDQYDWDLVARNVQAIYHDSRPQGALAGWSAAPGVAREGVEAWA